MVKDKDMKKDVEVMVENAAKSHNASEALYWSQSARNAANALQVLMVMDSETDESR